MGHFSLICIDFANLGDANFHIFKLAGGLSMC
jgi:hypothetical protein